MAASDRPSGLRQLVAEMKRRHVVRFALGYAAAAFVVLQLAEIVFPAFGIQEGGLRVLVVLTGLGFLPALVLAWVYDITTEGIKRTDDEKLAEAQPSRIALAALLLTTIAVTGGLGLYLADQGVLSTGGGDGPGGAEGVLAATYDPDERIRSLAVLPLDDFSPSGDQAYLTSSMHEELIAKLSLLEDVRVVSRTTVMRYADPATRPASPQIGRELGVDALIEGSVTRSDDLLRVTLQIIHAPSDSHIQTLQWEREGLEDVLAFQTEIAHAVADSIGGGHDHQGFEAVTVARADPDAQDAYLRAKHEYGRGTPDGNRMALEYFQEALEKDPGFTEAMAGAAGARFLLGLEDPESLEQELVLARREALMALDMDSSSVHAKEIVSFIERSIPRVREHVVVVHAPDEGGPTLVDGPATVDPVELDWSAYDTAWVTPLTGLAERIDEQMRQRGLGARGAPGGREAFEARQLASSGNYVDAARLLERVVAETPELAQAWDMLARSYVAMGDVDGASDVIARWHESGAPNAPDESWVLRLEDSVEFQGPRGYWSWTLDRLTMYDEQGMRVPRVEIAAAHAALGNDDEAFTYLFEALERGEPALLTLRSDPVWDDLRDDPRYRRVAEEARALRFAPARRPGQGSGPGR